MITTVWEEREDCPVIKKHCKYYCYKYDNNDEVAINFCAHPDNINEYEGNCKKEYCPIIKE